MVRFIKANWVAVGYLLIYFGIISTVLLNRFWQFEVYYFDHGLFESSLWQAAKLQLPIIDHFGEKLLVQFGDHLTPTLYLLTPMYWLSSSYELIFWVQASLVAGSALIVYITARGLSSSKLTAFTILVAYSLFIGMQNAIIANFHTEMLALVTLSLALYAITKKRWKLFWVMLILTLGAKESFVGIGLGIGVYLFLAKEKKQGLWVMAFSLGYYLVATRVVIPYFSGIPYIYETVRLAPGEMVINFFSPSIKLETMAVSFTTFGLLPFFAPAFLPAIFQDFFIRFVLNNASTRWDLGLHYNATLAVLLAFGASLGAYKLERAKHKGIVFGLTLLALGMTIYYHRFSYHGPLGLVMNPVFYRNTQGHDFLREYLATVPNAKTIMTQNHLAPHLTHQGQVVLLREEYFKIDPDVVVFDARPGQSPNNLWPLVDHTMDKLITRLEEDPKYRKQSYTDGQFMFIKK